MDVDDVLDEFARAPHVVGGIGDNELCVRKVRCEDLLNLRRQRETSNLEIANREGDTEELDD